MKLEVENDESVLDDSDIKQEVKDVVKEEQENS